LAGSRSGPPTSRNVEARRVLPQGTDIPNDPDYLWVVAAEVKGRPRKVLGWRNPAGVFAELLTSGVAATG